MNNLVTNIFITIMLVTALVGYDIAHTPTTSASEPTPTTLPTLIPTPTAKPLVFDSLAKQYVYDKFGDDYPKAFKIIDCESKWNTKAFNDNTAWGGIGQDRGIWQINNVFHPISDECAYDYKCSTDYAYRMYKNDNFNFSRWTCGRK